MALQHLRSGTAHKRPIPTAMSAGQIAINTNEASPGLFFRDSNGDLVKVGPVHIGTTAPNANPASTAATALVSGTIYQILTVGTTDFTTVGASANTVGTVFTATGAGTGTGTVSGQQGVEKGEQWLDTTGGNYVLKIYDGTAWRSESGTFVDASGDTMTGALLLDNAASASAPDISFDGDTDTGIYSSGANTITFAADGEKTFEISKTGNNTNGNNTTTVEVVNPGNFANFQVLNATGDPVVKLQSGDNNEYGVVLNRQALNDDRDAKIQPSAGGAAVFSGGNQTDGQIRIVPDTTNDQSTLVFEGRRSGLSGWDAARIDVFTGSGNSSHSLFRIGTRLIGQSINVDNHYIYMMNAGYTGETPSNSLFGTAEDTDFVIGFSAVDSNLSSYRESAPVFFGADGSGRLTGNFGIGSLGVPQTLLDISGNNNNSAETTVLRFSDTDTFTASGQNLGKIEFHSADETDTGVQAYVQGVSASTLGGAYIRFGTKETSGSLAERARITDEGYLGLGVGSPGSVLQLGHENTTNSQNFINFGTRSASTTETNMPFIGQVGGTNGNADLGLGARSTDGAINFYAGNSTVFDSAKLRMTIKAGGNVGINTSSPLKTFHVEGSSLLKAVTGSATLNLVSTQNLSNAGQKIAFFGANRFDANEEMAYIQGLLGSNSGGSGNVQTGDLAFGTSGLERVRITSVGKVGIRSSSPSAVLEVGQTADYLNAAGVKVIKPHSLGLQNGYFVYTDVGYNATTQYETGGFKSDAPDSKTHAFVATTGAGADGTGGTVKAAIFHNGEGYFNGKVGIGTSDPDELLHIKASAPTLKIEGAQNDPATNPYGSIDFENTNISDTYIGARIIVKGSTDAARDGEIQIQTNSNGTTAQGAEANLTTAVTITKDGEVGIGTTTPTQLIDLEASTGGRIAFTDTGTRRYSIGNAGTGSSSLTIRDESGSADRIVITNGGNVGIGTSSNPSANLEIENNGLTSLRLTRTNTESNYAQISASGSNSELLTIEANPTNETGGNLLFRLGGSEAARIDPGRRLLVGHTSYISAGDSFTPQNLVYVENAGSGGYQCLVGITNRNDGTGATIVLGKTRGTSNGSNTIVQNNDILGQLRFVGADGNDRHSVGAEIRAAVDGTPGSNDMPGRLVFRTTADGGQTTQERVRIAANGDIKMAMGNFGNTGIIGQNLSTGDGVYIDEDGGVKLQVSRWNGTPFGVNRMSNDGDLIAFFGQGTNEGGITLSGTTVSLTGGHLSRWSQLESNAERTEILRGSVLSNLDEMCEWGEEDNEQLNRMKVSDVEGDPNVAGVFQGWDDEDETYLNDFHCAMTGDFIIRIAQGTTVARGDLLMSAGDGTAKPQGDDIVRSKTIAKVTSTTVSTTYADGSYCVPCVLMAC